MALPEPSFIERDVNKIVREYITLYEAVTGKILQPGQPERLFIDVAAYREYLLRLEIQNVGLQNLVNYAKGVNLDHLALRLGVERLPAQPARTTIRFTLVTPQAVGVAIPVGTRVQTKDGKFMFTTDVSATIAAGSAYADVVAVCTTAGAGANGYIGGDIAALLDVIAYVQGAVNISVSAGGADEESDDRLRQRVKEAPESYSVAGSRGAYRFYAQSAHPDIIDVGVITPSGGTVNVYPLTVDGEPAPEIISAVEAILNAETVRPLTDYVVVQAPEQIEFTVTADITVFNDADFDTVQAQVNAAVDAYAAELRSELGRDIVLSQIQGRIMAVYGVYNAAVTLKDDAEVTFTTMELVRSQYGFMTAKTVNMVGFADG